MSPHICLASSPSGGNGAESHISSGTEGLVDVSGEGSVGRVCSGGILGMERSGLSWGRVGLLSWIVGWEWVYGGEALLPACRPSKHGMISTQGWLISIQRAIGCRIDDPGFATHPARPLPRDTLPSSSLPQHTHPQLPSSGTSYMVALAHQPWSHLLDSLSSQVRCDF
jgi:hypothetical protein